MVIKSNQAEIKKKEVCQWWKERVCACEFDSIWLTASIHRRQSLHIIHWFVFFSCHFVLLVSSVHRMHVVYKFPTNVLPSEFHRRNRMGRNGKSKAAIIKYILIGTGQQ